MSKKYYVLISILIVVSAVFIFKFFTSPMKWKIYSVNYEKDTIYKDGMEKFIKDVKIMTNGKLIMEYIPLDEKNEKKGEDIFDKVAEGTVEMGVGHSRFWAPKKIPGSDFWYAIPFGLNASDMYSWLYRGGGLELWREMYEPFNVVPFPIGDTGGAMGGWFRSEISNMNDINDIKSIRDSGLPARVWERLEVKPEELRGNEIFEKYKKGNINAIVVLGPYVDQDYFYQNLGAFYYYPGWEEPCGLLSLVINKDKWDQLPDNFKKIIEMACESTYHYILNRFNLSNSIALLELQKQGVKFREFPPEVLDRFREKTDLILEEESKKAAARKDEIFLKVYKSFKEFKEKNVDSGWGKIVDDAVFSGTTVLNFRRELSASTVANVYQRGNKNVVISLIGDASFYSGSATPSPALIDEIPGIRKIINENSISIKSIMVEGHTDNQGDPFSNWKLSMARANTVVKLLTENNGINPSLIRPVFYGDTFPNKDNKNPADNRRIDIVIEF